jgi:hypothetical protein
MIITISGKPPLPQSDDCLAGTTGGNGPAAYPNQRRLSFWGKLNVRPSRGFYLFKNHPQRVLEKLAAETKYLHAG